ncbi:alpha/beta-hydrolase [Dentipellis sp. KUC8613]|nr:alpha/beta-hydrolase [Dentipellis sp. KUC8613]
MNAATATASASGGSGTLLPLPPAREIPSTFLSSVKSWWSAGEKESAASEERLLRRLPFFRSASSVSIGTSNEPVIATSSRITLKDPKQYLNTLSITSTSPSPDAPAPAVLLHGYGAGLGFFCLNFPALAQWAGLRGSSVYALDWLGMGRSARVPFRVHAKRDDIAGRVHEAESFFVDSLEQWREQMGLEKMTLVGHSLGGYLSVVYALRYPQRVSKLVLLSPAGVPRDPNNTMPAREVSDEQMSGGQGAEPASASRVESIREEQKEVKRKESRSQKLFTYLWEEGWSPFQVVRSTVFWGPMLVGKYSSRRFSALGEEQSREMHEYFMNISLAKGSGEYCISHLLAPGAHARMPLVDRIAELKIPVTFVYGEHDWMDPDGGVAAIDNMRAAGNNQGRMYVIPHAGHHVYLDNAKAVNKLLMKELDLRGQ